MRTIWIAAALALAGGAAAFFALQPTPNPLLGAEADLRAGRIAESEVAAEAHLRGHPRDAEALFLLARAKYWRGDFAEANRLIGECAGLGLDEGTCRTFVAALAAEAKPDGQVERVLREAARAGRGPEPEVTRALARAEMARYRLGSALTLLDRWTELAPWDPTPWIWRAEIGTRSGKEVPEIAGYYEKALQLDPNRFEARIGLAHQFLAEHRNAEAAASFEQALSLRPEDPIALLGAGRNAFEMGDLDAAAGYSARATKAAPDHPEGFKRLGAIALQRGDAEEAKKQLDRALKIEPSDQEAQRLLGRALGKLGDEQGARAAMAKAEQFRKDDELLTTLRKNVLRDPSDIASRAEIVRWLLGHQRPDEAIIWSEEIFRMDPGHRETHRLLAGYYGDHGEPGKANYHRLRAGEKP